jgi:hypothetical protein
MFSVIPDLYSSMRNTTKLKQILLKYDLDLSMDDDSLIRITLVDKSSGILTSFENNSYSTLISKAYSYFLKAIREETQLRQVKAR